MIIQRKQMKVTNTNHALLPNVKLDGAQTMQRVGRAVADS